MWEEVCWAIGNIAGDSDDYRSVLLQSGTLLPMANFMLHSLECLNRAKETAAAISMENMSSPDIELYQSRAQTAVWAISNMARGAAAGTAFLESGELTNINISNHHIEVYDFCPSNDG